MLGGPVGAQPSRPRGRPHAQPWSPSTMSKQGMCPGTWGPARGPAAQPDPPAQGWPESPSTPAGTRAPWGRAP